MVDSRAPVPPPTISVWLVEDDSQYRQTISYLLDHTSGLACRETFQTVEKAHALLSQGDADDQPDVVLMDIGLPGINGIEGVARLKALVPRIPIVMLTVKDNRDFIFKALRAGASGYLLKDTPVDQIIAAIREAYHGGTLLPASVANHVLDFFARSTPQDAYHLSEREMDVLRLMGKGYVRKEIAEELYLSPHTIDNHVRKIYEKLHVSSNVEAVAKAIRKHLI